MSKPAKKTVSSPLASVGFRPFRNMTLIRRDPTETAIGRLILPDGAKKKPQRGTILAVGPGERLKNGNRAAMLVRPGDRVVFGDYSGFEVEVKGETLVVVHEPELLGVIE